MSLSRKRRKELHRLRREAESLWGNQQIVLDHAAHIAREAGRQIGHLNREVLAPRVNAGVEQFVQPGVARAAQLAKSASRRIEDDVLPVVGRTLGSVLAVGDAAREIRIRKAIGRVAPAKAAIQKRSGRGGALLGIGVAFAIIGALGYAVWQTYRADDELWVAEDANNEI
ncbi:MAG TPA: DNA helicase [Microbacteriaceae bacterium]|nr:DNA helicase [Microbacteriaceae bacterium]